MAFEIVFKSGAKFIPLSKIFGVKLSDGSIYHLQRDWILSHQATPPTIVIFAGTRFYLAKKSNAVLIGSGAQIVAINLNFIERVYDSVKGKVLWPPPAPPKRGCGGGGQGFEFI